MTAPRSISGRQLFAHLPEVYRDRDNGDLAGFLDAVGELLDRMRWTLDQRLDDCFPETAQPWLLPYFAQLLDARLTSPHEGGRRDELTRAIAWRQRKGTRGSIEEIAEAVGRTEVTVQEGWRRVAVTPRVDRPLLPAQAFGLAEAPSPINPLEAATHPGLPTVTVEVAATTRAVRSEPSHPLAEASRFGGEPSDDIAADPIWWRQLHPRGVPCSSGFDDATRRTVDLRTPDWRRGHHHPRRVLLFAPPPTGFFPLGREELDWSVWRERVETTAAEIGVEPDPWINDTGAAISIATNPPALVDRSDEIRDLRFLGLVRFKGPRVVLRRVAVRRLIVDAPAGVEPVIEAIDCLFDEVEAPKAAVRLEHSTVKTGLRCKVLQASDSLLAGEVDLGSPASDRNCARFTRLPPELGSQLEPWQRPSATVARPVFFDYAACRESQLERSTDFGHAGHCTLHPATPDSICFGAEDGGEMGAYHHRFYCLGRRAVLAKLEDFLPIGLEAVLVPDPRLLNEPPAMASEGDE